MGKLKSFKVWVKTKPRWIFKCYLIVIIVKAVHIVVAIVVAIEDLFINWPIHFWWLKWTIQCFSFCTILTMLCWQPSYHEGRRHSRSCRAGRGSDSEQLNNLNAKEEEVELTKFCVNNQKKNMIVLPESQILNNN